MSRSAANTLASALAAVSYLFLVMSTHAETRAIVVGISNYASQPTLPGAAPDAEDIRSALSARGISNIQFMSNADATRARLDAAVRNHRNGPDRSRGPVAPIFAVDRIRASAAARL